MDLSKYMSQFIEYYNECLKEIMSTQAKELLDKLNLQENNQINIFDESLDVFVDSEQKPYFVHQVKFKVSNS